jgi:hypothetical protein
MKYNLGIPIRHRSNALLQDASLRICTDRLHESPENLENNRQVTIMPGSQSISLPPNSPPLTSSSTSNRRLGNHPEIETP